MSDDLVERVCSRCETNGCEMCNATYYVEPDEVDAECSCCNWIEVQYE